MNIDVCDCCEGRSLSGICASCKGDMCDDCERYLVKHGRICLCCYDELPPEDFTDEEKKEAGIDV